MGKIDFEAALGEGSVELLAQLESALGTKGREATLALIKKDPAARRLAEKIIGAGSPAAVKAALDPAAAASSPVTKKKAGMEF